LQIIANSWLGFRGYMYLLRIRDTSENIFATYKKIVNLLSPTFSRKMKCENIHKNRE